MLIYSAVVSYGGKVIICFRETFFGAIVQTNFDRVWRMYRVNGNKHLCAVVF